MLPIFVALLAASTPAPLDARQIYVRARATVNASAEPPYVVFTYNDATRYDMVGSRGFEQERLRIAVRTSDGHAFVQTLRTPTGFQGRVEPVVVGDNAIFPNTNVYRLGDFPTADSGLRNDPQRPGFFEASATAKPSRAEENLRVIGSVSAVDVPYRLHLLADDTLYGRPMYHLSLRPLRDRGHNVLREMWVDRETFEPRRYVAERFVGSPVLFSYYVTVDEARIAQYMINTTLTGRFESQVIGHPGTSHEISPWPRIRTTDAAWSISEVSFPATLPTWLFDPTHLERIRTMRCRPL